MQGLLLLDASRPNADDRSGLPRQILCTHNHKDKDKSVGDPKISLVMAAAVETQSTETAKTHRQESIPCQTSDWPAADSNEGRSETQSPSS